MNRFFLLSLAITGLLASHCFSMSAPRREVALTKDGKPGVYLVLDGAVDQRNQQASEDFVQIIQRISGARIPITEKRRLVPIYLGELTDFPRLPFEPPSLDKEAFLLKVTPKAVFLLGGSSLGTQHAVYTLLRDLGCRWVMPGEIGECLPKNSNLVVQVQERVESPDFRYREIWYGYGCSAEAQTRREQWMRRNRMYRPPVQHGHNLINTLKQKASFEETPELYALIDGKRKPLQVCTSNPEVVKLVTQTIREYFDRTPDTEAYSLCPDDNTDFCQCENCRALDTGRIDRGGAPSVADRYQVFLNQVLEGLADSHPNALVCTYSYNRNHTDPPRKVKVHPNTCIFATTSMFCAAHGIGDKFCKSRQDFKELIKEWTAHTSHVYIYEYDPIPYSGGLPWPMWEAHGRAMPVYKELGIKGFSFEGQNSWAPFFPNYYIAAQMMWDSSQDYERLFDDMMNAFFQEVAAEMKTYYGTLASHIGTVKEMVEWGLTDYPKYFPEGVVAKCRQVLQQAKERAQTPMPKKRVEMVSLSFQEMDAYLKLGNIDSFSSYEQYMEQVAHLNGVINRMAAINEDYLLANIAKRYTAVVPRLNFEPEKGYINRWLVCGPFDSTDRKGLDTVYPPEEDTNLSAVYKGKKGVQVRWKASGSPDWSAYVDLLGDFEHVSDVVAYALCWVTVKEGPRQVLFWTEFKGPTKVLLNGTEIWNSQAAEDPMAQKGDIPATLPEGTSAIMLKLAQGGGNWGFYFRITDVDSEHLPNGLSVSPTPPPSR